MKMGRKKMAAAVIRRGRGSSGEATGRRVMLAWCVRWWRWLAMLVLVVFVVTGGRAWLMSPGAWPIRVIRVEGAGSQVRPEQVRAIVDGRLGAGFFGISLGSIAGALKSIPWVHQADVARHWPDTLVIRLQLQRPVASWNGTSLLNRAGHPFSPPVATFPKNLPALAGPSGKGGEVMQHYLSARKLFAASGLQVVSVREDARRAFRLWFSNGIELVIGRQWDTQRMARLSAVYVRLLAAKAGRIARIDLRYPNGFAVAWKPLKTDGAKAPAKE